MNGDFTLAVHALVFLNHKQTTVSSQVLAENICTHAARVRKVMAHLKRAELIETKEGRLDGGYRFSLNARDVSLKRIAEAINTDFISSSWKSGRVDKNCLIASAMAGVMDSIYNELNKNCRELLEKTTIADIDDIIFGKKKQGEQ